MKEFFREEDECGNAVAYYTHPNVIDPDAFIVRQQIVGHIAQPEKVMTELHFRFMDNPKAIAAFSNRALR